MIYKHNGSIITDIGGKWLSHSTIDPYNPLNLPPNTFRVRTNDGSPHWVSGSVWGEMGLSVRLIKDT